MTRTHPNRVTIKRGAVAVAAVLLIVVLVLLVVNFQRGQRYAQALRLAEAGDAVSAYDIFASLGSYADSAERAAGLVQKDPALPYRKAAKGDVIAFGSFEQDGDTTNGAEPIRWIVLERFDDRLLVLSADVLDGRQYNHVPFQEVTWADSDLRAWMNDDFLTAAFGPAQQGIIATVCNSNEDQSVTGAEGGADTQDRVFALSETESVIYLSSSANRADIGAAPASAFAASGALTVSEDGTADWWLRSPGTYGFAAQFVDAEGKPSVSGANVDVLYGVRPALWIDVSEAGRGAQ
ncbi:MAG: hypothetical protein HXK09_04015 [Actinomyces bouchesdurhonensis]|uniref:DUF6273 domain-containing protein n=1 Tax=Actinomyces bouchesdurhonensis TaxID=1852361 RepID=A0A929WVN3_9ACTO|nr:hypothetical protein [Actinomyces bouchesdurhonensis]